METVGKFIQIFETADRMIEIGAGKTHFMVPNDWWLAGGVLTDSVCPDRSLFDHYQAASCSEASAIICPLMDTDKVHRFLLRVSLNGATGEEAEHLGRDYAWVSPAPFAVMVKTTAFEGGGHDCESLVAGRTVRHRVLWPRQIHKGELGISIPVPDLETYRVVSTATVVGCLWVALTELARVANMSAVKIVSDFLCPNLFSPGHQPSYVYARDTNDLSNGVYKQYPIVRGEAEFRSEKIVDMTREGVIMPVENIWVAPSIARNILRLISLRCEDGIRDFMRFKIDT